MFSSTNGLAFTVSRPAARQLGAMLIICAWQSLQVRLLANGCRTCQRESRGSFWHQFRVGMIGVVGTY